MPVLTGVYAILQGHAEELRQARRVRTRGLRVTMGHQVYALSPRTQQYEVQIVGREARVRFDDVRDDLDLGHVTQPNAAVRRPAGPRPLLPDEADAAVERDALAAGS